MQSRQISARPNNGLFLSLVGVMRYGYYGLFGLLGLLLTACQPPARIGALNSLIVTEPVAPTSNAGVDPKNSQEPAKPQTVTVTDSEHNVTIVTVVTPPPKPAPPDLPTSPRQTPDPVPVPEPTVNPPAIFNPDTVLQESPSVLERALGTTAIIRREGSVEIWQYHLINCVADFFFYPNKISGSTHRLVAWEARSLVIGQQLNMELCREDLNRLYRATTRN